MKRATCVTAPKAVRAAVNMKRLQKLLVDYGRRLMAHPEIIDQKVFHRKKVEILVRTAFADGMNYMTRAHNNALAQLNDAFEEEVEGHDEDLTTLPDDGSIDTPPEGEPQEENTTLGHSDQTAGPAGD